MKKFMWALSAMVVLAAQPLMAASFGTLDTIIANGNSITFGDKTFSNFAVMTSEGPNTGGGVSNAPSAADISVTVTNVGPVYNLLFSGFSLTADGFAAGDLGVADLTLTFDVKVNAANTTISGIDMTAVGSLTGTGHAFVDETATYPGGSTALHADAGGSNVSAAVNPPSTTLHIIKDASVLASGNSSAHISAIEQSFEQRGGKGGGGGVPEINPNVFASARSLLFGCVAVMMGRRKVAPVVG
jgi:hypothetical protein